MAIVKQRQVSEIIHEFADLVQSKHDAIIATDPGYDNLCKMLRAMQMYAERIGGDLGIRLGGVVAAKSLPQGMLRSNKRGRRF